MRRLLAGMRMRTTIASTLVVACALTVGGFAFVAILRSSLTGSVQDIADQRAAAIVSGLMSGSEPQRFTPHDEELLVQIVDVRSGRLLASSDGRLTAPVGRLHAGDIVTIDHVPIGDGTHSFRTVARTARTQQGAFLVIVGGSLEHVYESTRTVSRMLLLGIPGLLLLIALTTWLFTGRALRPVESIRQEVADISARDLNRRVPVPNTGDEIARLADTMNEMLGRLADASERHRHFISDASHELRSPVATIRSLAEVASEHPDSMSVKGLATTVLAEERRLESLVDDLLLLARADEDTLLRAREPIDLDDLVFEEAARLRATSTLRIDTSKVSAARVQGDAESLRRALRNVADNAMRHAVRRVGFEVSSDGPTATVTVVDDGMGVSREDRARIFERFIRLDTARDRESGGSGLGLSIVAEIVAAHDGSVTVGDAPGAGARFELRLPLLEAPTG
jgi:signal transduction histidine kinase